MRLQSSHSGLRLASLIGCLCLLRISISRRLNHGAVLAGTDNVLEAHGELPRPTRGPRSNSVAALVGLSRTPQKSWATARLLSSRGIPRCQARGTEAAMCGAPCRPEIPDSTSG
jgi:hypothetical protein